MKNTIKAVIYKITIKFSATGFKEYSSVVEKIKLTAGTQMKYCVKVNSNNYLAVFHYITSRSAISALDRLTNKYSPEMEVKSELIESSEAELASLNSSSGVW